MKLISVKKLVYSNCGAITVFLCLILVSSILLVGVLIDGVRVAYALNKVNSALESSVRSVLAGYHRGLVSDSGVFALNANNKETQKEFLRYLGNNLPGNGMIKFEIIEDGTKVEGFNWLTGDAVLKRQILEFMKYRVPFSAAANIIDRFKAAGLPEKSKEAEKARTIRKDRSKIISTINTLNEQIYEFNKTGAINSKNLAESEQKLNGLKQFAQMVQGSVDNYKNSVSKGNSRMSTALGEEFGGIGAEFELLFSAIGDNFQKIETLRLQSENYSKNAGSKPKSEQISGAERVKADIVEDPPTIGITLLQELSWSEPVNNENFPEADDSGKNAMALLNKFYEIYKKASVRIDPKWMLSSEEIKRNNVLDEKMKVNMEEVPYYQETEAEKTNDGILAFIENMVDKVEKAASGGMENIYINEYILSSFSYVTSSQHLGHLLEKGEAEYILFGSRNQLDNIKKMAERLAFTRFALNSLDYFINSTNPHPFYRLAYSMSRGVIQTGKDMLQLYQGKAIDIIPSAAKSLKTAELLKMDYADNLRLFLLLQPEKEKLSGIRQLIQLNMKNNGGNFELADYSASVHASIRVKVNLWFIPMFIPERLKTGPFEGKYYIIDQKTYKGY